MLFLETNRETWEDFLIANWGIYRVEFAKVVTKKQEIKMFKIIPLRSFRNSEKLCWETWENLKVENKALLKESLN